MVEYQIVVYDAPIWTVYMHVNKVNGKKYVGITMQKPEDRWKNGHGYNKSIFKDAIKKYGWDNFNHVILLTNLTKFAASVMEIYFIKRYNTCINNGGYGYNWQTGGFIGGIGIKQKPETVEKYSKKVVCVNTGIIYRSQKEAARLVGCKNPSYIGAVCRGEAQSSGKGQDGNPLIWMYYDDYVQLSKSQIEKVKNKMILQHTARPVICINNEKIFVSAAAASDYCGSNAASITRCCQTYNGSQTGHPRYHVGKNPENNEWLAWMYLDEYEQLSVDDKQKILSKIHPSTSTVWNRIIICLNSLEVFESATSTICLTTLVDNKGVQIACRYGAHRTGGRNPITNEKLHWMYYDQYEKLSNEEKEEFKQKYYTGNLLRRPENQDKEAYK